ncbi:MAG: hypothetical protein WBN06_04465 [Lysobacterales bacterium]
MVSNELKKLLDDESEYSNERVPDPLLLPRIASRITPEKLRFTARAAEILSDYSAPYGWPPLADATAEAIALRHTELSHNLFLELCDILPQLPTALIRLDQEAGQRAEHIIGSEEANWIRVGLDDPTFVLREAVSELFCEPDAPHTADELMAIVRDRTELESPEMQRKLLAYFLPMAPASHHQWMIEILVNVLGFFPRWSTAAAISRIAGLLDQTAIEQVEISLNTDFPSWTNYVHHLLTGSQADSVFLQVARALPYDDRIETLFTVETEPASLEELVDEILHAWGGAPPPMAGRESVDPGDGDEAEEAGFEEAGPEETGPEDAVFEEAWPEDLVFESAGFEESGPEEAELEKSKEAEPEEAEPEEAGPEEAGPEEAEPEETEPEETEPEEPEETEETEPEEAEPEEAAPEETAPEEAGPEEGAEESPPISRSMRRSMSPPSSTPPSPAPLPERRLQAQVFADDEGFLIPVTRSFMKDMRHDVRLWIGPQTKHSIGADKRVNEPAPDSQELQKGSMEIVITLVYGSVPQTRKVDLPIDRRKRSSVALFSLDVDKDAAFVSADVWLQHKGRIIQYLKLNGLTGEEADNDIALEVETLIRGLPEDTGGGNFEMAMVKKDDKYIVFGPRGAERTEVSLQGSADVVKKINKTLFNATKGLVRHSADHRGTSWVGDHDEEAMKLLREMARYGNLLYQHLKVEGILERISETIQFVNLDESDIVPIEYVYDRGYPEEGSTLCEGFREAEDWNEIFAAGQCSCSNRPQVKSNTLCPMGFWSLSKIIERQSRPRGTASTSGFVEPSGDSGGISLARHAVLAAAPNVKGLDVNSIKSMLEETYPNRYKVAADWKEWETEIKNKSPRLLILLPHHGDATQGHTDFLEIGNQGQAPGDKLYAGLLSGDYVTSTLDEPGPIVLLLGCETAQSDLLPFHTFARDFLANRASIVVATQASVLGQHAAPVANEFIRQLLASKHAAGSFGKVMRDVRRKMFAGGYLMSLALVSFGDSDWKIVNTTGGDSDVPH